MSYTPTLSSKRVDTVSSTWGPKLSNNMAGQVYMHCHKYHFASLIITLFTYYLASNIEILMQSEAQQYSCKHGKTRWTEIR